ncbi:hypothetical protein FDECE_18421 [Fusarium decemcellulare]|nr:hypothetical protein FDECE_18421 [Fusarium decemcellulare]
MVRPTLLAGAILAGLSTAAPTSTADLPRTTGEVRSESDAIGVKSFMGSCHSCYTVNHLFTCTCHNGEGQWFSSVLDLDSCLGNADGWLRWQNGTSAGNWIPSFVMLDERIHNSKGYLWCGV